MWTGNCTIMVENNTICRVKLLNAQDDSLFAQSTITDGTKWENFISRTYDSSRAFAITLVSDQGQKATIGIIFDERSDAFDFINGLDEFKRAYCQAKGLSTTGTNNQQNNQ